MEKKNSYKKKGVKQRKYLIFCVECDSNLGFFDNTNVVTMPNTLSFYNRIFLYIYKFIHIVCLAFLLAFCKTCCELLLFVSWRDGLKKKKKTNLPKYFQNYLFCLIFIITTIFFLLILIFNNYGFIK